MKGRILLLTLVVAISVCVVVLGDGYDTMPADALIVDLAAWGLQPGKPGGTIQFAGGGISTWNPANALTSPPVAAINQMLKGLVALDPVSSEIVPELAKGWDISGDGLTVTFYLREGLNWSDGEPFTADDVVFSFNGVYCNDGVDCIGDIRDPLRLPDDSYPSFESMDSYTIRMTLSQPVRNHMLDALVLARILPKHVLEQYVEDGTFNDAWSPDVDPSELAGMGPYVPYGWDDSHIKMRRNSFYYHYDINGVQLPYFDKCKILNMNTGDQVNALLDGEIDAAALSLDDIGLCEADDSVNVIIGGPTYGHTFVSTNLDIADDNLRGLFRNVSFRRAIAHAMDKARMIAEVYDGYAYPQWSAVSIPSPFYAGRDTYGGPITESDAVTYDYNLVTAAALLDDCGIVDIDADGIREFPDGTDVEFDFVTNAGNEQRANLCQILTGDLTAIGLKVNFNPIDWNDLIDELHNGTYEMLMVGLTGGPEPNNGSNIYRSTGDLHFWHYSAATGDIFTYEQTIDGDFNAGLLVVDNDAAFPIYKDFQTLQATEDLGLIYTVHPDFLYAVRGDIGNKGIINERNSSLTGVSALPVSELLYREAVFVDDDWTGPGDCGGHNWGVDAFATVQEGVNAVGPRGVVAVYDGTYDEDVTVNKQVVMYGITGSPTVSSLTLIDDAIAYESDGITADTVYVYGNWASIQEGIHLVTPGGTVVVGQREYDGGFSIDKDVTLQAADGCRPIINGPQPQNWDEPWTQAGIFIDGGSVAIYGFTFRWATNGILVRGWDGTPEVHLHNNYFYDNGMGIDNWTDDLVDATDNWWGYASGPYHPILNPGGEGNRVGENIEFIPFRTDPLVSTEETIAAHNFPDEGWNLVSVPFTPMVPADADSVFGDDVGDLTSRLYRYNPATPGYGSGGGLDVLPEYGFWLYLNDAVTIDVAGEDLTGADYTTVAFADGWQQIGTPFSTYWKDTQVSNDGGSTWISLADAVTTNGWMDNAIHQWDAEHQWYETISYAPTDHTTWDLLYLKPWNGYWIKNKSGVDLKLKFTYATPPSPTSYSMMAEKQTDLWTPLSELGEMSRPPAPPMMPQVAVIAQNVSVMVAPNPVQQGRVVEFQVMGAMASFVNSVAVQVYTMGGKLVFAESAQGQSVTWDLTTLSGEPVANGLYLYVAQMEFNGGQTAKLDKLLILK